MLLLLTLACAAPATFDISADDYLTMRPSPDAMVGADGLYNGGWYESFDGVINPGDALAPEGAFKGWLHFSLQNDLHIISVNVADMGNAGNTAITVVDHTDGSQDVVSIKDTFSSNPIVINEDFTEAQNTNNGSYIRAVDGGRRLEFDVTAEHLRITGTASALYDQDYVQITRYHDGYGILQWYGNIAVEEGTLTTAKGEYPLGPETRGAYDRMAGHRRTHQSWNWVGAVGTATRASDGAEVGMAFQITKDQEYARPVVDSKKYAVWVDGELIKLPSIHFDYERLTEEGRMTGEWQITTDPGDEPRLELTFDPISVRTDETGYLWFYHTDFNQYCGYFRGELEVDGEVYIIEGLRGLGEDSILVL